MNLTGELSAAELLKVRRERMRWFLMVSVNASRPARGMHTEALLPIIQATYEDATHHEIRRELDYLEDRELVKIVRDNFDRWVVELTRDGVDVVEYTVPCDAGISRPRITQV